MRNDSKLMNFEQRKTMMITKGVHVGKTAVGLLRFELDFNNVPINPFPFE